MLYLNKFSLKCEVCDGDNLTVQEDCIVCSDCGIKYSFNDIMEIFFSRTKDVFSSVKTEKELNELYEQMCTEYNKIVVMIGNGLLTKLVHSINDFQDTFGKVWIEYFEMNVKMAKWNVTILKYLEEERNFNFSSDEELLKMDESCSAKMIESAQLIWSLLTKTYETSWTFISTNVPHKNSNEEKLRKESFFVKMMLEHLIPYDMTEIETKEQKIIKETCICLIKINRYLLNCKLNYFSYKERILLTPSDWEDETKNKWLQEIQEWQNIIKLCDSSDVASDNSDIVPVQLNYKQKG